MADKNDGIVVENEGNRFTVSGSLLGLLLLAGLGFYIQFGRIIAFFREAATVLGNVAVEGGLHAAILARDLEPRVLQGLFWLLGFFAISCGVIALGLTVGEPSVIFIGGAAFLAVLLLAMTGVSAAVALAAKAVSAAEQAIGAILTAITGTLSALKLGATREGKFELFAEEVWRYKVRRIRLQAAVLWLLAFVPLLAVPNWHFVLKLMPVVWGFGLLGASVAMLRNWDMTIFWRVAYVGSGMVMIAVTFAYFWPNHAQLVRCALGETSEKCLDAYERKLSDELYEWAVRSEETAIRNQMQDPVLGPRANGDHPTPHPAVPPPPRPRPEPDEPGGMPEPLPPEQNGDDINVPPP